ncbi:MAG: hypothetical protein QXW35_04665, partial [Candidatus Aenigmatarchaeota archaeon]
MVKIKSKIGLNEEVVLIDNFGNEVKVLLKKDEIYDVHEEVAKIFVENNWGEIVEKEFEKFLDFLDFFNENGYFEVRLIRNDVKIREFFERKEDLVKFLIGNGFENYDVFVSLNKRKNKGGTINDVNDNVRIIFVDIDKEMGEKEIEEINRKLWESGFNAMIIAKSGKGLHLYFVLDRYISKDEFYELSEIFYEYLENLLNVKIDRLNIDVSRCVRLVGSYNHKYLPKRYVSFYVVRNFKDEVFYVKVDKIKGLEEYKRNKIREKFNEIKYLFESFIVGDANKDEVRSEMIKILQDFDIKYLSDEEVGELLCILKFFDIKFDIDYLRQEEIRKYFATKLYELAESVKSEYSKLLKHKKKYSIEFDADGKKVFKADGNVYRLQDFGSTFSAYYKYVFAEKLSELLRKISSISSEFNKRYEWIEYVFNNAEKFYDGRVRFLMFCGYRYLVCIKNYDFDKAYEICKNF